MRPACSAGAASSPSPAGATPPPCSRPPTAVARREGRPTPVPLTLRARDVPQSHESEWQEHVVRHLGLDDWIRLEVADELDCVGPLRPPRARPPRPAVAVQRALPLPDARAGRGRDAADRRRRRRAVGLLACAPVRRRRHLLRLAPFAVRRAVLARREPIDFPWLRDAGARRGAGCAAGAEAAARRGRSAAGWPSRAACATRRSGPPRSTCSPRTPARRSPTRCSTSTCGPRSPPPRRAAGSRGATPRWPRSPGHLLPARARRPPDQGRASTRCSSAITRGRFAREWDGRGVPADLVDAGGAARALARRARRRTRTR